MFIKKPLRTESPGVAPVSWVMMQVEGIRPDLSTLRYRVPSKGCVHHSSMRYQDRHVADVTHELKHGLHEGKESVSALTLLPRKKTPTSEFFISLFTVIKSTLSKDVQST